MSNGKKMEAQTLICSFHKCEVIRRTCRTKVADSTRLIKVIIFKGSEARSTITTTLYSRPDLSRIVRGK